MTNFIPIFPLGIVVYPGEKLNLHIFEPRYKQLIQDCFAKKKPFGIPAVIDGKLSNLGTIIDIIEISNTYDNGEMDIKTKGSMIFNILETIHEIPEKLYKGAIVTYRNNYNNGSKKLMMSIIEKVRLLYKNIEVHKDFGKQDEDLISYDIAHLVGMTLEQEFELLGYENELHRQEYLKRHLLKVLPVLDQMNALQEKIKLNGHFKNLEGFGF